MPEYIYTRSTPPSLQELYDDVAASTMTNKSIDFASWDEDDSELMVCFAVALSSSDESELYTVVSGLS